MIHRISLDGRDLGSFDHGTQGRTSFVDAATGQPTSLPPVAFNPASQARSRELRGQLRHHAGMLEHRRVEPPRVGPRRVARARTAKPACITRCASSPDFGDATGRACPKTRSATRCGRCGSARTARSTPAACGANSCCRTSSPIRRTSRAPATAGRSPTSPSRPARAAPVMLVAERGGIAQSRPRRRRTHSPRRTKRAPSATSSTRAARGAPMGRYDVGMYDRSKEGAPYINANCAGGATFGPGYTADGQRDRTADSSSGSPATSCARPTARATRPAAYRSSRPSRSPRKAAPGSIQPDDYEVHGVQGQPEDMYNALVPPTANVENQQTPAQPIGPDQAYMVDIDINVDPAGNMIPNQVAQERRDHDRRHQRLPGLPAAIAYAGYYRRGDRRPRPWRQPLPRRLACALLQPLALAFAQPLGEPRPALVDRPSRFWSDGHWRHLSPSHRRHMSPTHWRHISPMPLARPEPDASARAEPAGAQPVPQPAGARTGRSARSTAGR